MKYLNKIVYLLVLVSVFAAVPTVTYGVEYEAENAILSPGFMVANNHAGYSGTGFVDYVGEGYVEWTFEVSVPGEYILSFRYALRSGDRPLDINVNGEVLQNTSFPSTGSWDTWRQVTGKASLEPGTVHIRAQTRGVSGPNMDRLDVTVENPSPAGRFIDNGDGTITDTETNLIWEKKLSADGSDGGNCQDPDQSRRSVHCVNNAYTWTSVDDGDITNRDGTVFTDFLAALNQDVYKSTTCFANHCDWRIPRISELETTCYQDLENQSCPPVALGPTATTFLYSGYWSYTSDYSRVGGTDTRAFYFIYPHGSVDWEKDSNMYVRAVRGGD